MSTELEKPRIHFTKAYKIDPIHPTEFKAPLGTVVGLHKEHYQYIVIEHVKRFTEITTWKVLVVDDDEEFDIKDYQYAGSFGKTDSNGKYGIKHVYYVNLTYPGVLIPR